MTDCSIIDLQDERAQRLARRTREAMIAGPAPLGLRTTDRILVKETGRVHPVWGFSSDGRPICFVDGARTVLQPYQWERLS